MPTAATAAMTSSQNISCLSELCMLKYHLPRKVLADDGQREVWKAELLGSAWFASHIALAHLTIFFSASPFPSHTYYCQIAPGQVFVYQRHQRYLLISRLTLVDSFHLKDLKPTSFSLSSLATCSKSAKLWQCDRDLAVFS